MPNMHNTFQNVDILHATFYTLLFVIYLFFLLRDQSSVVGLPAYYIVAQGQHSHSKSRPGFMRVLFL